MSSFLKWTQILQSLVVFALEMPLSLHGIYWCHPRVTSLEHRCLSGVMQAL